MSPSCASSGTVEVTFVVSTLLSLDSLALGNAIPVIRSISLPLIVISSPFLIGEGVATSWLGTTVVISPKGILIPLFVTAVISPSATFEEITKVISEAVCDLKSAASMVAPFNSILAIWSSEVPLRTSVSPALMRDLPIALFASISGALILKAPSEYI